MKKGEKVRIKHVNDWMKQEGIEISKGDIVTVEDYDPKSDCTKIDGFYYLYPSALFEKIN